MRAIVLILSLLLSACTTLDTAIEQADAVSEQKLAISETGVCGRVWVASLMKRYSSPERLRAWFAFCYPAMTNPFDMMDER